MTLTHAKLLTIVSQRYPHLDADAQSSIASAAILVMSEPHWVRVRITPLMAVKLASQRSKHMKSF